MQSQVFATNTGIFVSERDACLVDPGISPPELDAIEALVADRGAIVRGIILTHAHWDHLLGPARFPSATVIAHKELPAVIRAHRGDLERQVREWRAAGGWEPSDAFVPPKASLTFDQHVTVHLGSLELNVIFAPGHAPDHCVVYVPATGVLWAGDMLSDLEIPLVMDSISAYRQTLQRLAELEVRLLVPGHGTPTDDAREIGARFSQDLAYLERVWSCAAEAVTQGMALEETVVYCRGLGFAQPDDYPNAHAWNIEHAFAEAGGLTLGPVGWEKEWIS